MSVIDSYVCLADEFFLCFFVFRFSFYCLHVLCYNNCIVTSRVSIVMCFVHIIIIIIAVPTYSSMHHYECVALRNDISLQRGLFCARFRASCIPRSRNTGHHECSSSRLCAAAPVVASSSLEEVRRRTDITIFTVDRVWNGVTEESTVSLGDNRIS